MRRRSRRAPGARRSRATANGRSAGITALAGDTNRAGSGDSGSGSCVYGGCATDAEVSASSRNIARPITRLVRHTSRRRSTWMSPSSWTSGLLLRFRSSCCPSPASPASPASTSRCSSCPPRRVVRLHREAAQTPRSAHAVRGHRETESSTLRRRRRRSPLQRPETAPSGSSSTPTRKPPSAHSAPPRQKHGPQLPFGQSRSYGTAGSGTSGGRVPTVPVAAVAAIIAFFILAAPRLGRRLPGCAGAEPARHVPLLDRPPGLRAVGPRPDAAPLPPAPGVTPTARRETR